MLAPDPAPLRSLREAGRCPAATLQEEEWWYHRGQLMVYLRLLGIEVPCIYAYEE